MNSFQNTLFKILSFIWPVKRAVKSGITEGLELTWYNGKIHLDSKNSNYSYGQLQEVLEIGLKEMIALYPTLKLEKMLILGLGGGSIIKSIRKLYNTKAAITAVEIDPVCIKLSQEVYQLYKDQNLDLIEADAFDYVANSNEYFNLIVIDLFIDQHVVRKTLEPELWQEVSRLQHTGDLILFNAGIQEKDNLMAQEMLKNQDAYQLKKKLSKVKGLNDLYILERKK